jgi:hypothetical protein
MELGAVESVKVTRSGLVIIVCVSAGQRERVLRITRMGTRAMTCFALKNGTIKINYFWGSCKCEGGPAEGEDSRCL